jgi:hypothetical protein
MEKVLSLEMAGKFTAIFKKPGFQPSAALHANLF